MISIRLGFISKYFLGDACGFRWAYLKLFVRPNLNLLEVKIKYGLESLIKLSCLILTGSKFYVGLQEVFLAQRNLQVSSQKVKTLLLE